MSSIDALSTELLEQAKRFLEKASAEAEDSPARSAYCHAALLLGFSSLESHVNAVADELTLRPNLGVLDKSILTERDFTLENGHFVTINKLKIYRFEDRLRHMFANFSASNDFESGKPAWWPALMNGVSLRNKLVHPKEQIQINQAVVGAALQAILECINALYIALFNRKLPAFNRGLHSNLSF